MRCNAFLQWTTGLERIKKEHIGKKYKTKMNKIIIQTHTKENNNRNRNTRAQV